MPEPLTRLSVAVGRLLRRLVPACLAQRITGTPGAPNATTTIPGTQLPAPEPPFGGVIRDGALQSRPCWAGRRGSRPCRARSTCC